ncbi:plasmid replication protein, CyRepA1 family [Mesorhizobium sp. M00.F.Ca.ET.217.01.1.1]|uniref:plasmid replication protein, CyRepA1 family n=1 Tax=Mesorhizobium sp. M00.F.Ca.ET.217.01.1.1 TaxID=2500529 RepID=UPI0016780D28|nr:plasmid replication protein, CyRepA1 family [Mesorhizobium sp. M00.F.Ca.ET.217.01.1.1]
MENLNSAASDDADSPPVVSSPTDPHERASWLTRKLRLSINRRLIDKNSLGDEGAFVNGFVPHQLDVKALLGNIMQGYSYCAELKGPRSNSNFKASDLLSVDIDGTMTLDEAVNDQFVAAHGTFIYTTASHTDDKHHFRIGFALERTIEDAAEMRAATRSLILKFGGDAAASDPSRIFFGNRKTECVYFNRGIPSPILDELIAQGRDADQPDTDFGRRASTRSRITISPGKVVISAKRGSGFLDDFDRSEQLFCPFHKDTRPSAFVIQNRYGQKGIRCSACVQSFWATGYNDHYDFQSFEKAAHAILTIPKATSDIDKFFPSEDDAVHMAAATIDFTDQEHLKHWQFVQGATFIRSPKGSGKTELLKNLVQEERGRFLLIGHRRTLIRSMCNRLGLDCYLDDEKGPRSRRHDRYGICLDSLMKIKTDKPYDYILIDESEQVLAHFLSSTMAEKRLPVLHRLRHLVSSAKKVIALDADLSWNTFRRISEWRNKPDQAGSNRLIINTFRKDRGTIHLVPTKTQLIGEIHRAIADGKRCFITANNRGFIEKLEKSLLDKDSTARLITITSKTVQRTDERIASFLADPKSESSKYQVILASPSLGTGVDFSFDNEEDRFDIVFGMFDPLLLTHFGCDQQLARVRSPKEVRVFVNPARFTFETDLDTVTADALSFEMMGHLIKGYDPAGREEYLDQRDNDPLLRIAASVLSVERASKNDLKAHFIEYVQRQGWEVVHVQRDESVYEVGSLAWVTGSALHKEHAVRRLVEAKSLSDDEFEKVTEALNNDEPVDDTQRACFARSLIERFYRREMSEELIELDEEGKTRKRVRLFEQLINEKLLDVRLLMASDWDPEVFRRATLLPDYTTRDLMVLATVATTPFYTLGEFKLDAECCGDDLSDFVRYMQKHTQAYETQFGKPVRVDLEQKPMSQLRVILKMAGLSLRKSHTRSTQGEKTYFYKIDPASFAKMEGIANQRRVGQNGS